MLLEDRERLDAAQLPEKLTVGVIVADDDDESLAWFERVKTQLQDKVTFKSVKISYIQHDCQLSTF